MPVGPVDWQSIHSRPLIAAPGCWRLCDGGICCSGSHPDFVFRLIPKSGAGTVVVYLENEYAWMRANGHVVCGEEAGGETPPFEFDFGGPRPLILRHMRCGYLGRCDGVITKPLLCRSYPFLPVFGLDGELEDVLPASITDVTLQMREGRYPCPLNERKRLEASLAGDPVLHQALKHPYIVFHTQAAAAFLASYRERLLAWEGFHRLSGPEFWQAWEMAYLGRRLADRDAIAARILGVYEALAARHGDFLGMGAGAVR